jgi:uncharacterized membrane protein YdjX (TVP38/TMEM64 family)
VSFFIGSSVGELPPYLCAQHLCSRLEQHQPAVFKWLSNFQGQVEERGVITIVLLAAWPNAAIDMTGLAAGLLEWPLRKFLCGIMVGKVLIRCPVSLLLVCAATRELLPPSITDIILNYTGYDTGLFAFFSACLSVLVMIKCLCDVALYEYDFVRSNKE